MDAYLNKPRIVLPIFGHFECDFRSAHNNIHFMAGMVKN